MLPSSARIWVRPLSARILVLPSNVRKILESHSSEERTSVCLSNRRASVISVPSFFPSVGLSFLYYLCKRRSQCHKLMLHKLRDRKLQKTSICSNEMTNFSQNEQPWDSSLIRGIVKDEYWNLFSSEKVVHLSFFCTATIRCRKQNYKSFSSFPS